MKRLGRCAGWGGALLGALALTPLACAGRSVETGNPTSNGGSAGTAGVPGNGGQAGSGVPLPPTRPPVNRFPCEDPQVVSTGLERCIAFTRRTGPVSCQPLCAESCTFQCREDKQCEANEGCDCPGGTSPTCVPIGCTSDADCLTGFNCASYSFGCGHFGYACQLPSDECASAADCNGLDCAYTSAGRKCTTPVACLL